MNFVSIKERIAISADFSPAERDFILDAINASIPPPAVELLDPGNYMGRIAQLWAFLSIDDGGEGLCAAPMMGTGGSMPLIGADLRRVISLKPVARAIAHTFGKPVRLAKFRDREDIEIFQP